MADWLPGSLTARGFSPRPIRQGDAIEGTSQDTSIWIVSVLGGPARKLRDQAIAYSISRDGSTISFDSNKGRLGDREIWVMRPVGERHGRSMTSTTTARLAACNWSPDGQRALYEKTDEAGQSLVSRDLKGGLCRDLPPR